MATTTMADTDVPASAKGAGLSDVPSLPREASAGRLPTGHEWFVLDLPVPPSVNAIRRINWVAAPKTAAWKRQADALVRAAKYRPLFLERFELHITVSERSRMDLDHGIKALIDYLVRIEAIADDAPANLRRLVVEWGEAPEGVRVVIKGAA